MAITDARILRSFKITESKGDKGSIQYSATEDYLVICDAKNPSFADILQDQSTWLNLNNGRLPRIDDELTVSGKTLYVTSRDLSYYKENERAVVMSVRYDAKDADAGGGGEDPTGGDQDAWKRVQVQSTDVSRPARGWRGKQAAIDAAEGSAKPAINSAGDPVDGIEEEGSMLRFTYTNTIASNPNFAELAKYTNKCNTSSMTILGVFCSFYTVRCTGFNAQYDQKNNTWSVTVELLYNPSGWEISFYDAGFNEIVGGKRQAIVDGAGNPISSPCALDGNGRAVAPEVITDSEDGGPAMRVLYPYVSTDLQNMFNQARI